MAEVLGPIVGSTNTMTILRPPQDAFQAPPSHQSHMANSRATQVPRASLYNHQVSAMAFRQQNVVEMPQYAYNSPALPRQDRRKSAGPALKQQLVHAQQPIYQASTSSSASSGSSSSNRSNNYLVSKDDSAVAYRSRSSGMQSRLSVNVAASMSSPELPLQQSVKPSPDRYRRQSRNIEQAMSNSDLVQPGEVQRPVRPVSAPIPVFSVKVPPSENTAPSNSSGPLKSSTTEEPTAVSAPNSARYKRRSVAKMDSSPVLGPVPTPVNAAAPSWSQVVAGKHNIQGPLPPPAPLGRPVHVRSSSSGDTRAAGQFTRPLPARNSTYGPSKSSPELRPTTAPSMPTRPRSNLATPVNSSSFVSERPSSAVSAAPTPTEQHVRPSTAAGRLVKTEASQPPSPAVQQLSAITEKQKGVKNRIRRAFSFSSSAELRKASAENNLAAERAKLRKERFANEQDAEDAAVAAKQEASGLGNNIYSHQGRFAGSTDNISMSSTASSASIMLRNIGRGMKKSTRNLRSLFRPKSMIDSPSTSNVVSESSTEVTLVNIEAEREKVNVNVDPHEKPGGGTGYPKLERNSVDQTSELNFDASRRSIVGGDRERAEVLAAVRKGILKRAGTSSTSTSPVVSQSEVLLPSVPGETSAPGTSDGRTSSSSSDKEIFTTVRLNQHGSSRSLPTSIARNISFNSRVQFFDVWSSSEYDRRGEIATCNRLTPMLAQQIKEELNSFKMEMEVHEESKPHTHFF